MPEHERTSIQADLIWTGDYNGIIDSDFGDNSVAAVKNLPEAQRRPRDRPPQSRRAGEAVGSRAQAAARTPALAHGRRPGDGRASRRSRQARAAIDARRRQHALARSRGEIQIETFRINAPSVTLASVFDRAKKEPANRRPEYQTLKTDFFVVSGAQGGVKRFYVRGQIKGDEVRGVTILYDNALETTVDRIVVAVSNAFSRFPAAQAPVAVGSAPRRPVEYATGIVVSKAGHIVTDRTAVGDCQFVIVPGFGNAARVADDKASDVTLLQVLPPAT